MDTRQHEHIHTVMRVVSGDACTAADIAHDEMIRQSWQRCVHDHRLDPTRMQEAVILPRSRLREHQDRIDEFLRIARRGLEDLYRQVAGMGYVVLLTDDRGITVDFLGDLALDPHLRKAGLYLGSDWNEAHAGTCGVGTAIATGQSLTVHQADHFDATHIPLTCTTSPVFDPLGRLTAVLDISALVSPQPKESQHLALQLVRIHAQRIENASFLQCFRRNWVLKLDPAPEFAGVNPEYLVALGDDGRIIGHNRRAQLLLEAERGGPVCGTPFSALFNATLDGLGHFVPSRRPDRRAVTLARSGKLLFLEASPPPLVPTPRPAGEATARRIPPPLAALSGGDTRLDRQIDRAARLVNSPISVLLSGETGTGKEYFAKALHESSERRSKPFIAVNCAAIPDTLIESELFGHLPNSFSGAGSKGKRGLIREADGGTLFLDEIGDMPRDLQSRLLRVLAEREVLSIGAARPVPVDVRVISATHCDLEALVRDGRFRDDLYYRLNGAKIQLPPLREREDFDWIVQRMLRLDAGGQPQAGARTVLSDAAFALLRAHAWPGNLRELHNVLAYAMAVCGDGCIEPGDLPDALLQEPGPAIDPAAAPPRVERAAIDSDDARLLMQYLRAAHWNVSAVARQLGLSRMTLYRRMRLHGIASPNRQDGP